MGSGLKKQTAILTAANVITRALGFLLRLLTARLLGAEALGVVELASSASMPVITPLTAGLPTAMSRLTAKAPPCDRRQVLRAGLSLVRSASMVLLPAFLLLTPLIAWLLPDGRTLPALLAAAPCIPLLGLCSAYGGWCYGCGDTLLPSAAECAEQVTRFALTVTLLLLTASAALPLRVAVPAFSGAVAALVSVGVFRLRLKEPPAFARPSRALRRQLFRLAVPTTLSRLCVTGMRALLAVLLPACLMRSGLTPADATALFGMLSGMALPLCMMPSVFTGALGMVASPALSAREDHRDSLRHAARRMLLVALIAGVGCAAALFLAAELISTRLYRLAALAPVLRFLAPLTCLIAVQQVTSGMLAGLGLQRRALTGTILNSAVTLTLTALLAPLPAWRLYGAGLAMMIGQAVGLAWSLVLLLGALRRPAPADCSFRV